MYLRENFTYVAGGIYTNETYLGIETYCYNLVQNLCSTDFSDKRDITVLTTYLVIKLVRQK